MGRALMYEMKKEGLQPDAGDHKRVHKRDEGQGQRGGPRRGLERRRRDAGG